MMQNYQRNKNVRCQFNSMNAATLPSKVLYVITRQYRYSKTVGECTTLFNEFDSFAIDAPVASCVSLSGD